MTLKYCLNDLFGILRPLQVFFLVLIHHLSTAAFDNSMARYILRIVLSSKTTL